MKKHKMLSLVMVVMSLGLFLISCGGQAGDDKTSTSGIESAGDLETLSNNAYMKSQPHYQHFEILPSSYIQNAEGTLKQQIRGDAAITYSPYTGEVCEKYCDYDLCRYESSFNLTNMETKSTVKISSCSLVTELDGGEYRLGMYNPENPTEMLWEDNPVLLVPETLEVGATYDYNSSIETGGYTVKAKEYVVISNTEYPAWKIYETSSDKTISVEEYRWVNPQYGILKMQITMTSKEDGSVMFLDGVLREYH